MPMIHLQLTPRVKFVGSRRSGIQTEPISTQGEKLDSTFPGHWKIETHGAEIIQVGTRFSAPEAGHSLISVMGCTLNLNIIEVEGTK